MKVRRGMHATSAAQSRPPNPDRNREAVLQSRLCDERSLEAQLQTRMQLPQDLHFLLGPPQIHSNSSAAGSSAEPLGAEAKCALLRGRHAERSLEQADLLVSHQRMLSIVMLHTAFGHIWRHLLMPSYTVYCYLHKQYRWL